MEDTLKTIYGWIAQLETLPAGALTIGVCIALGYVLKFVPEFPNARIPLVTLPGGALFYMLVVPHAAANPLIVDPPVTLSDRARQFGIGLILAAAAWMIHKQVLKRIEDSDLLAKFAPGLSSLFQGAKTTPPPTPADPPKGP